MRPDSDLRLRRHAWPRSALVVDDDPAAAAGLKSLLGHAGYATTIAADVFEGIAQFAARCADVVFLDARTAGTHAAHAAQRIKSLAGNDLVPVILVGGAAEAEQALPSLAEGADDVLAKPVDARLLAAKLRTFERLRSLSRTQARLRADWEVAQELLGEVVMGPNARSDALHVQLLATDNYSADIYLSEYSPAGDLNVLLGDFTGHGLAAALAAMPVAEIFRSMTAKGFAPQQILSEMNRKLAAQLPTGRFLAAAFVQVSRSLDRIWVANCGMPDVLVLGAGSIRERIRSHGMPLGIQPELDPAACMQALAVTPGERVLLSSDGIHEAVDSAGRQFGRGRLEQAAVSSPSVPASAASIVSALDAFRDGEPMADDASLVEILLAPELFAGFREPACTPAAPDASAPQYGRWHVSLDLHADALRISDPVPMLLAQLQAIPGLEEHRSVLYTVLSELYSNALDHGVLELDSRCKDLPNGFELYVAARERALASLTHGWVRMGAVCTQWPGGGALEIRVQDSGSGFDWQSPQQPAAGVYGRGLALVRGLCRSLTFEAGGSCACALYSWGEPLAAAAAA